MYYLRKILKYITVIFIVLLISLGSIGLIHINEISNILVDAKNKISKINPSTFKRTGDTIIYDKDDKVINKISVTEYVYIPFENISENACNAFIAIEDNSFMKHKGISVRGNLRALYVAVKNKGKLTQGGSTITQQLVKNVFLSNKRTISRKIEEAFIAVNIEYRYSKKDIMEFYLNNIYFGNGAFGIENASRKYFSKPASQLSLSECAFLAAIPNNPAMNDPINYKENTIERRNIILKYMFQQKYIDKEQFAAGIEDEIKLNISKSRVVHDDYATSLAIDNAVGCLMEGENFEFKYKFTSNDEKKQYQKKYRETYSDFDKKIRSGGYCIYTSLDISKQNKLQESVDNGLEDFQERDNNTGKYKMQGAGVCIDNSTGYVVAAVGGRTKQDEYNRAILAYRQPGSAIKPLLAYAPYFDKGYHPLTHITDAYIPNGPKNAERAYFGNVSIRSAVEMSLNTVPFIIMNRMTPGKCIPYLLNMKFNGIYKEDYNAIAAVGGFFRGVSPIEMAGAYSTLQHEGTFALATCIKKLTYQDESLLFENKSKLERTKVYEPESAYMMTDILKGVLTKNHATAHGLALKGGHISAGKTGTTEECKDGWFCGYTKYYTTVIWCGYDNPEPVSNLYGATYPGHIWKNYMDKIHEGLTPQDFNKTEAVISKNINPDTGELVDYDTGVCDLFSKKIIDKIEEEKNKKEEAEKIRMRQQELRVEDNYRKEEQGRQNQVEKHIKLYEKAHYTTEESIYEIDEIIKKIYKEIDTLVDKKKISRFKRRMGRSTEKFKEERQNIEKQREGRIDKERIDKERIDKERIDKERMDKERIDKEKIDRESIEKEIIEKNRNEELVKKRKREEKLNNEKNSLEEKNKNEEKIEKKEKPEEIDEKEIEDNTNGQF